MKVEIEYTKPKKSLVCESAVDFRDKESCRKFARSVAWAMGATSIGLIKGKKYGWRFRVYYEEGKPRIKS